MVYIAAKSLAFSIRSGAKRLVLTQTDTQNCVSYSLLKIAYLFPFELSIRTGVKNLS